MVRLILILLCAVAFGEKIIINILERRSFKNPIPECLNDIYDNEKYLKWREYKHENIKLDLISNTVYFIFISLVIGFNAFGLFSGIKNEYLLTVVSIVAFSVAEAVISTVTSYISTFKIEEKYGFNKSTHKVFIIDTIKNLFLETLLTVAFIFALQSLYSIWGDYILIAFAALLFVFIFFATLLSPFFMKLFNKFTPLADKELEEKLTSLLAGNGIRIKSIKVMNASLRTTKSNAYFAGLGKTKSIVLYDNLVNNFTTDEIVAVFAHEMGHAINKDTLKNHIISFMNIAVMVIALWIMMKIDIYSAFGFNTVNYALLNIVTFNTLIPLLQPITGLVTNCFIRRAEYKADAKAAEEGYGAPLISALKKLARENFADLSPDKILVSLTYSHPTLEQRIHAVNKLIEPAEKE